MSVTSECSSHEHQLTIRIRGRFDFSKHQEFRDAYEKKEQADSYVVDLGEATYLDSSALGMLLLLRDHAKVDKTANPVRLINCNADVQKILAISNFDKLFSIS